ncbi:IclR family transcriptional regulator [Tranquillimonas alkanivorans]|uniref:Transcriptional regulator, IclR family n=1 Tax=Tranquillimonas alkanivorans TaxID=441119 RepID=A0A1I5VK39_9RHOB|nr:IclR family transcriptional regulator [Tranquillimonas alkanivorans]SFQ07791.1 transcriptional regulator, IclR family [Tranquillimonas alkanivorans]
MSGQTSRYRAPALDKGLDVLELLAEHENGLSQAEIAKALGRSPSELYRMLDTLVRRGYVRRSATADRLMLGLKLFALATTHPPMRRLLQAATEVTTEVAEATLQSCHLTLYRDGALFVAVQADSPGRVGLSVRLGAEVDLLTTGSGLAMLAFQTEARRARMLSARNVGSLPEAAAEAIQVAVALGHVMRPSSQTVGVTDLACPIIGRTGDAVAALSMPFIERLDPPGSPSAPDCLRLLSEAAGRLSVEVPPAVAGEFEHEEASVPS